MDVVPWFCLLAPQFRKVAVDEMPRELMDAIARLSRADGRIEVQQGSAHQLTESSKELLLGFYHPNSRQLFPADCGDDGATNVNQQQLGRKREMLPTLTKEKRVEIVASL